MIEVKRVLSVFVIALVVVLIVTAVLSVFTIISAFTTAIPLVILKVSKENRNRSLI